jgi:hypothetical protein
VTPASSKAIPITNKNQGDKMKTMSTITRKALLGVSVAVVAITAAACRPTNMTCTVNFSTPGSVTQMVGGTGLQATEFSALALQTNSTADQQGYQALNVIVAGIPVPNIARSIQQGGSSDQAFLRAQVTNALLLTKKGTAVLSMTLLDGKPVGSATFAYHVSGNQLRFDNPEVVDQWIVSYLGVANRLSVGIPDLVVDTGTSSRQVTLEAGVDYADVEIMSDRESWYSAKKNCARCLIP